MSQRGHGPFVACRAAATLRTMIPLPGESPAACADLFDWRRRVVDLYAEVRRLARTDPREAHRYWRATRDELFATHPQSPIADTAAFTGIPVWDYDPALRLTARLERYDDVEHTLVRSSTGQDMPLVRFGYLDLPLGRLDAFWINVYGGGVFVPFTDATSGTETYGAGRYLLDTAKSADLGSTASGELVLDFNFAYHPSCFYDSRWSFPLAPPQNVLGVPVRAGERMA